MRPLRRNAASPATVRIANAIPAELPQAGPERVAGGEAQPGVGQRRPVEGRRAPQDFRPALRRGRGQQALPGEGAGQVWQPGKQHEDEQAAHHDPDHEHAPPAPTAREHPQVEGNGEHEAEVRQEPGPGRGHVGGEGKPARLLRAAQGERRRARGAEHEHRVVARLLRVPDQKRRAGSQPGRGQRGRPREPAPGEPRDRRDQSHAQQGRREAQRPLRAPGEVRPQVQQPRVERTVKIVHQVHRGEALSDAGAAPREHLVHPEALRVQAIETQDCRERERRSHLNAKGRSVGSGWRRSGENRPCRDVNGPRGVLRSVGTLP
jgi:hypothetical protein